MNHGTPTKPNPLRWWWGSIEGRPQWGMPTATPLASCLLNVVPLLDGDPLLGGAPFPIYFFCFK